MSHTAHVREEALHLKNVRQLFQVLRVIQYQEFIVFYLSHPLTVRIVRRSLVFHSPLRRFLCVFVSITLINGLELAWRTQRSRVSLFWNINMAAVESCENAL